MKLICIPALTNNYIWLLYNDKKQCIIIDPGDHKPVLQILKKLNFTLIGIFLTHHHHDHVHGVHNLTKHYQIPVYGPKETKNKGSNNIVIEGDTITILDIKLKTISLPGHTSGHVGFYSYPWLFCGDTIFSAGCGKIFEGTTKQMYTSLQKIKQLNKNTLLCSAHEYTLSNINFAISITPYNKQLVSYKKYIEEMRKKNKPTLPSKLKHELKINLFLQCHDITLKKSLGFSVQCPELKIFTELRKRRDNY
ncbi:hydroxyacylglutathione hydrolase [Blochmannia endosymbiont of Polyrhachis (Hedomyrma) turneri]|uniref:hydroxyacylglutathione hydrolase n=1 Tax=Blochmannia endosymbiont of Polyrhachis (Hedomyrma) turneri TaxID=1505596 RepID=UPI00061A828A|nr:hydroxyacylglutathione hydrolase [Blochmannia endosymbiont of Polyrhachis (Hedomyrma) turneri]AKC59799.1 Hydroxyacylglutathione hydrolase [Blochmannia endosymbiont of Polyrhachis (Hedomyrma) turneri]